LAKSGWTFISIGAFLAIPISEFLRRPLKELIQINGGGDYEAF
jgi:hypothetical protein